MKAERFGFDVEIEIVAKALAGLRAEAAASAFGEQNNPNCMPSEPRNIRERQFAARDVHAAQFGAAVQLTGTPCRD